MSTRTFLTEDPSAAPVPDMRSPTDRESDQALDRHVGREIALAATPKVKRLLREMRSAARQILENAQEEEFFLAAAAATLDGYQVFLASALYQRVAAYIATPRRYGPGEDWLRIQLALYRFLELNHQSPGHPYDFPGK